MPAEDALRVGDRGQRLIGGGGVHVAGSLRRQGGMPQGRQGAIVGARACAFV